MPRENKWMYVHEVVADLSVYKETGYSADCFNCFISMYVVNMMSNQGIMPFEQNLYIHTNITI